MGRILLAWLFVLFVWACCNMSLHAEEKLAEILDENTRVVLDDDDSSSQRLLDKKISLDLRGVDVIELLKFLAMRSGINIVPSKGVAGRISLFLKDVTIEDALEIILLSNGLAYIKEGNIINVMTETEYVAIKGDNYRDKKLMKVVQLKYATPAQIQQALVVLKSAVGKTVIDTTTGAIILIDTPEKLKMMTEAIEVLDQPPVTKIFYLKYGNVKELEGKISAIAAQGVTEVQYDERTNKIMVTDLPKRMEKIERLVDEFDKKSSEVLIEAKIVQVILNNQHQSGIKWNYIASGDEGKLHKIEFLSNFQMAGAANVLSLSKAGGYDASLQLLNTMGDTRVLSSPRITTLNGKEAKIMVGTKEAYVTLSATTSQSQTLVPTSESVEFIEVGVKLYVTPVINEDEFVTMKIRPEVSSVTSVVTSPLGSKIPIVGTTEAETNVMIKNGVTLIIGGLMKDEKLKTKSGVPVLSKLPFLGALFRSETEDIRKTELVVFLTPHIITGEKNVMSLEGDLGVIGEKKQPKGKMEIE